MANKKQTLIEVARSFSQKVSNPSNRYENMDFFCSAKKEVPEGEAIDVSEELFIFCQDEVEKSMRSYQLEHLPTPSQPKLTAKDFVEAKKEAPARQAETEEVESVQGEERMKEANRPLKEMTTTLPEDEITSPKDHPNFYEEASYPKQDELGNNL